VYIAKFKVYAAELTEAVEEAHSKMAKENKVFRDATEHLKRFGGYRTLYKFELIELTPI